MLKRPCSAEVLFKDCDRDNGKDQCSRPETTLVWWSSPVKVKGHAGDGGKWPVCGVLSKHVLRHQRWHTAEVQDNREGEEFQSFGSSPGLVDEITNYS